MASIKDTVSLHTTEDSILGALKAVMVAEMQRAANEIIQKSMQDMANTLNERAAEIIARSVVKVSSEINPMAQEHRLHISLTIPMRY